MQITALRRVAGRPGLAALGLILSGLFPLAGAAAADPLARADLALRLPPEGFDSTTISGTIEARRTLEVVGASYAGAREVRLLHMRREGVRVEMVDVERIPLPAHAAVGVGLGPGSFQLMVRHLAPAAQRGPQGRLWLQLRDPATGRVSRAAFDVRTLPRRSAGHSHDIDDH